MSETVEKQEVRSRIRAIDQRLRVLDKALIAAYEIIDGIKDEKAQLETERATIKQGITK